MRTTIRIRYVFYVIRIKYAISFPGCSSTLGKPKNEPEEPKYCTNHDCTVVARCTVNVAGYVLPIPPRCTRAAALSTCAPVTELQLQKKVVGAQLPRVPRPGLSRAACLNLRDVDLAVLDLALDLGGALAVAGAAH